MACYGKGLKRNEVGAGSCSWQCVVQRECSEAKTQPSIRDHFSHIMQTLIIIGQLAVATSIGDSS